MFFLAGCAETVVRPIAKYNLSDRAEFYQLKKWSFDGRLALFDGKESWSASIEWTHSDGKDELKLSGP
ncbi:MAG: outer membrane lipoprotein LolB, partial [Methylococcaceae bacterium]|nr:outer membrane lipoprotein LolB [Methylococcaceae bacterium]